MFDLASQSKFHTAHKKDIKFYDQQNHAERILIFKFYYLNLINNALISSHIWFCFLFDQHVERFVKEIKIECCLKIIQKLK